MEGTSDSLAERLAELRGCICAQPLELLSNTSLNTTSNESFLCGRATAEADTSNTNPYYRQVEELLYTRVAVGICMFGLLGNICNLFVLIPQGRHCSMGRIEKFAYWGLVSLSVSDACCCILVIPHLFVERDPYSVELSFSLLYAVYGPAVLNVFTMVSTWLTVITAVGRYLAICHPFKARELIGMTVAKRAGILVYCACLLFNIPRFFTNKIARIDCGDGPQDPLSFTILFRWPGSTHAKTNPHFESVYNWIYFMVGVCIPCVFLIFSNSFLVRALRRARTKLRLIRAVEVSSVDQYRPITLTLVVLVLMHVLLVSPAEFVMFFRQRFTQMHDAEDDEYNLLAAVSNTLQAINFSVNFVLYYVINVHFRRALAAMLSCHKVKHCRALVKRGSSRSRTTVPNGSLTLQTCSMSTRIGQQVSTDIKKVQFYFDSSPF